MPELVLRVQLVPLGFGELGLWCDRCLLPSAGRYHYALEPEGRRSQGPSLHSFVYCLDCERKVRR